jgi:hypothetical protein
VLLDEVVAEALFRGASSACALTLRASTRFSASTSAISSWVVSSSVTGMYDPG